MIIDAQIHIWDADRPDRPWPASGAGGRTPHAQRDIPLKAPEVLDEMKAAGVDGAVLIPPSWEGERNDLAIEAVQQWPGRFVIMGRVADDTPADSILETMRQPGMRGFRLIFSRQTSWVTKGLEHPIWQLAAMHNIPLMVSPVMDVALLAAIVKAHPTLPIIFDHMATTFRAGSDSPWAEFDTVMALAASPNVAVKLTALPCYSKRPFPWDDVVPYCERLFHAYGADRLFWGSDLSRLAYPYRDYVNFFLTGLPWLKGRDRDLVMGEAIRGWLNWP
jgi:predicted TIM-barrel fold metal-dependent hydrolase